MIALKAYTPEEVVQHGEDLREEFLSAGWHDVLYHTYEVSASSSEELLGRLLNQPEVVPYDEDNFASKYATKGKVVATGNGASFGGWMKSSSPFLMRFLSWATYAPASTELREAEALLLGTYFSQGEAAAEEHAKRIYLDLPDGLVQPVRRGFIRVLTPVRYGV